MAIQKAWIRRDAVQAILSAWQDASRTEPCGVLLGTLAPVAVRVREAVPLPNRHGTPDRGFALAPEDLLRAEREAAARELGIVGFWHGHLRGGSWPGREDEEQFLHFREGPQGSWAQVLLVVGRGEGHHGVLRAFAPGARGLSEIPLRT